jgi:hypothetical protein
MAENLCGQRLIGDPPSNGNASSPGYRPVGRSGEASNRAKAPSQNTKSLWNRNLELEARRIAVLFGFDLFGGNRWSLIRGTGSREMLIEENPELCSRLAEFHLQLQPTPI